MRARDPHVAVLKLLIVEAQAQAFEACSKSGHVGREQLLRVRLKINDLAALLEDLDDPSDTGTAGPRGGQHSPSPPT